MSIAGSVGTRQRTRKTVRSGVPAVLPGALRISSQAPATHSEFVRKSIHMFPGVLPFALAFLPHSSVLAPIDLLLLTFGTAGLTLVYILSKKTVKRPDEYNFYSTCLSYPGCILATLALFPNHPEFACVVVVVLAFGDASAYIGGNLLGRRKLPWNPKKTWAGTLCFFAVAAPVASAAYWIEANVSSIAYWGKGGPIVVPLGMAALCGTGAALIGSVAESLPTRLTDNLRVGVAASTSVVAMHYLTAGWFLN
jgi:dolichol kinase